MMRALLGAVCWIGLLVFACYLIVAATNPGVIAP